MYWTECLRNNPVREGDLRYLFSRIAEATREVYSDFVDQGFTFAENCSSRDASLRVKEYEDKGFEVFLGDIAL